MESFCTEEKIACPDNKEYMASRTKLALMLEKRSRTAQHSTLHRDIEAKLGLHPLKARNELQPPLTLGALVM